MGQVDLPQRRRNSSEEGRHLESTKCPRSRHGQIVAPPRRARAARATVGEGVRAKATARAAPAVRRDPVVQVQAVPADVQPEVSRDLAGRAQAGTENVPARKGADRRRGDHPARRPELVAHTGPVAGPNPSLSPVPRRRRRHDGREVQEEVAHLAAMATSAGPAQAAGPIGRAPERDSRPVAASVPTADLAAHPHGAHRHRDNLAPAVTTSSRRNNHSRQKQSSGATLPDVVRAASRANLTTPKMVVLARPDARSHGAVRRPDVGRSPGPATTAGTSGRMPRPRSDRPAVPTLRAQPGPRQQKGRAAPEPGQRLHPRASRPPAPSRR